VCLHIKANYDLTINPWASGMLMLQMEQRAYEAVLPRMLKDNDGRFVVIRGSEVCNVLGTYEEALNWGYNQFGLDPFFVKQISAEEHVAHFSRDLGP
jgi:hypothetical protein